VKPGTDAWVIFLTKNSGMGAAKQHLMVISWMLAWAAIILGIKSAWYYANNVRYIEFFIKRRHTNARL
jgi:hypothetical protein